MQHHGPRTHSDPSVGPSANDLGCSGLSAIVAIRASPVHSFLESESSVQEPPQPAFSARIWFFSLGVLLNVLLSGALILGCTPFQDALVRRYGYSTSDATTIWGNGFQILVMGTAVTSPILDVIGPRWFAVIGLGSECAGLGLLAHAGSYPLEHGVGILSFAYGLVGLGGNMLMLASMPFCQLFRRSSTAASIMMGAYQAAGFMFMLLTLQVMDFWTFFSTYQLIAGAGLLAVFLCFPDVPYKSPEDTPRCTLPVTPCNRDACVRPEGRALQHAVAPLLLSRTWYFLLCFSLAATVAAWCAGAFYAQLKGKGQGAVDPTMRKSLIFWMPLASNSTFLFTPLIGALMDARGFCPAIILLCLASVSCVATVWLLPLTWQWLTLLTLNWLLAVTYSLQLSYITCKYAADQFGAVMSYSTIMQSVINLLGVYLLRCPPSRAAACFVPPCVFFCFLWAREERRRGGC
ncbi:unnamed protein product [Symbiodinium natans]|uniref:Uncharacterized protein n=1 Tax=Symbiodinium natans TaxID=878477 RepID=A0A812QKQ7_9DINO|nr:unnamed protein product [Symbiodinium natans]